MHRGHGRAGELSAEVDDPVACAASDRDVGASSAGGRAQRGLHLCGRAGQGQRCCGLAPRAHIHAQCEGALRACRGLHALLRWRLLQHRRHRLGLALLRRADLHAHAGLGGHGELRHILEGQLASEVDEKARGCRGGTLVEADCGPATAEHRVQRRLQRGAVLRGAGLGEVDEAGGLGVGASAIPQAVAHVGRTGGAAEGDDLTLAHVGAAAGAAGLRRAAFLDSGHLQRDRGLLQRHAQRTEVLPGTCTTEFQRVAGCARARHRDCASPHARQRLQRDVDLRGQRRIGVGRNQRHVRRLPAQAEAQRARLGCQRHLQPAVLHQRRQRHIDARSLARGALAGPGADRARLGAHGQRGVVAAGQRAAENDGEAFFSRAGDVDGPVHVGLGAPGAHQHLLELAAQFVADRFAAARCRQRQRCLLRAQRQVQRALGQGGVQAQDGLVLERGLRLRAACGGQVAVDGQLQALRLHRQAVHAHEGCGADVALQRHPLACRVGAVAHDGQREVRILQVQPERIARATIEPGERRDVLAPQRQHVRVDRAAVGQREFGSGALEGEVALHAEEARHAHGQQAGSAKHRARGGCVGDLDGTACAGGHRHRREREVHQAAVGGRARDLQLQAGCLQREFGHAHQANDPVGGHHRLQRQPAPLRIGRVAGQHQPQVQLADRQPRAVSTHAHASKGTQVRATEAQHPGADVSRCRCRAARARLEHLQCLRGVAHREVAAGLDEVAHAKTRAGERGPAQVSNTQGAEGVRDSVDRQRLARPALASAVVEDRGLVGSEFDRAAQVGVEPAHGLEGHARGVDHQPDVGVGGTYLEAAG